jgi:hypothetical protein
MITYFLILIILVIVGVLISPLTLLSDATLPAPLLSNLAVIGSFLPLLDVIFPVSTLLSVLGIMFSVEAGVFVYKIIMWIVRKIPTIS